MKASDHSAKEIPAIELQEIVRTGRCPETYAIILAQAELDRRGEKAVEACVHSIGCGQYEAAKPEPVEPWIDPYSKQYADAIAQLQRKHDALEASVKALREKMEGGK